MRFAKPADLEWLLPVFWIGFNIAMFPASVVTKRRGGLIVMGAAGLLGAIAVVGAEMAGSLNMLIAAQFLAGAAWGCMLMSAVSAALAIGETGAEGKVVGLVFSALALATFARMAAVAGGLQKAAGIRAAAALGAGGVLVGGRRRAAGAGGGAGAAEDADNIVRHSGMRLLAQARNPYTPWWLWIPGSTLRVAPE